MMFSKLNKIDIRIPAIGISLLLSVWCIYIDPVINNDGFLYILIADTVQEGNYSNAFNIYRWPFYSFMIAGLSSFAGFSAELTAYIFNALLIIVLILSYLSIVKLLGGDHRVLIVAVIVILLFPGINRYRSFINRDFGYLAFYMLGLFYFFRHLVKPAWYFPVLWTAALVVAALFRIEAVVLLISLPFIYWFVLVDSKARRAMVSALYGLVLVGIFLIFAWWFAGGYLNNANYSGVEGAFDIAKRFIEGITASYSDRLDQMRVLLTQYSRNYAPVIVIAACINYYTF